MKIFRKIKTAAEIAKKHGWSGLKPRISAVVRSYRERIAYRNFVEKGVIFVEQNRENFRKEIAGFTHKPLISIVLPVYNVEEKFLRLCIDSVRKQIYENWELCIADDCSPSPHIRRILEKYPEKDSRIKVVFRPENGHISAASNSALELATGEFCVLLDHDDELSEDALFYVVKELNGFPETEMIYSDEDLIDKNGRRSDPKFKPDFSRDLFYSGNLVTHLSAYQTARLREIGGFTVGMEGSQDYDLALRVIEKIRGDQIRHIPRVLYHWRVIKGSVAYSGDEKPYAHEAARRAISAHLKRCGKKATVEPTAYNLHRVRYELPQNLPKVSLIIIAGDDLEFTKNSLQKLIHQTDYHNLEIVLASSVEFRKQFEALSEKAETQLLRNLNFSTVANGTFSEAEIYNSAAGNSTGEILCFLDINLRPLESDWLKEMVSFAIQTETGAVGAKILYKNGTILHGGLIVGKDGTAAIAHHGLPREKAGNISRAQIIGNFSAVSVSCLAAKRENFEKFGGFDAEIFPNKLFDVDLCLKMLESGLRNVFTPYAEFMLIDEQKLINVQRDASESEKANLIKHWKKFEENDPFYNQNLHY